MQGICVGQGGQKGELDEKAFIGYSVKNRIKGGVHFIKRLLFIRLWERKKSGDRIVHGAGSHNGGGGC